MRLRKGSRVALTLLLAVGSAGSATGWAVATRASATTTGAIAAVAGANVGWSGFGDAPQETRHSPLTQINRSNVSKLGRLFTVDFRQLDPAVRLGEQSYPVEQNGTLYMTTNDDNVWALNATTGAVKWRWTPPDVAVFSDFGIVANRGVAVCDGRVFVLTLDMNIVSLNQATGSLEREVPISQAVPGATVAYGYSETSAPICFEHLLIFGAAGSEYGVRGFVMAYHTDNLTPAWPNPFWTIPPAGTEWRRSDPLAGGGVIWTPVTVDPATNTLYFGTGSATPLYFPSVRPGADARADSLVAVNVRNGRLDWWQQQMSYNEWSYDTSQPPLVYTAKVGGAIQRVVSVATMEGLWFAYNAKTGRPIYLQVKVLDHTEHPALQPGKPVAVFPSSIGGFNYSPASFDPRTGYVLNAAAETAAVETQAVLTPTQRKDLFTLGDVWLGLSNGDFGEYDPGYHDYGSLSAINLNTGAIVWKDRTPQPERGGITTTAGGLGFAGGGDGVLRAFNVRNGKIIWTFQTGHQIAAGPSVYSVAGTEYLAITVGGTPTSSGGGTATQLQVFALGGSSQQSQAPVISATAASAPVPQARSRAARAPVRDAGAQRPRVKSVGVARIVASAPVVVVPWSADTSNVRTVSARVLWNGTPVVGAHILVGSYPVPRATDSSGGFSYELDDTVAARHVIRVSGLTGATVDGRSLTAGQRRSIRSAAGGFISSFAISALRATIERNGSVLVSGRATDAARNGPPGVHLLTYELSGRVTDAAGKPVKGAFVVTRTQDRNYWTRSNPSNANGYYRSFFPASDQTEANPVPISVGVADGKVSYGGVLGTTVNFARLKSAVMNVQLNSGTAYTITPPVGYSSSIQSGLTVGVTLRDKVVKPLSARWPSANGRFLLVLPSSVRGHSLSFFEDQVQVASRSLASPGGRVDIRAYPARIGPTVPLNLTSLTIPRR